MNGDIFLRILDFLLVLASYTLTAIPLVLKTECRVDPSAGLDCLEKKKTFCLFRKAIPASPIIQPVPQFIKQSIL